MVALTITSPGGQVHSVLIDETVQGMAYNIRRGLTMAGLILKAQIVRNLSGPSHTKGRQIRSYRDSAGTFRAISYDAASGNPFPGVVTGALKASVRSDMGPDGMSISVGPHTNYAGFLEFGTSKMRPYPYVWPAWESRKDEIINMFAATVIGGRK